MIVSTTRDTVVWVNPSGVTSSHKIIEKNCVIPICALIHNGELHIYADRRMYIIGREGVIELTVGGERIRLRGLPMDLQGLINSWFKPLGANAYHSFVSYPYTVLYVKIDFSSHGWSIKCTSATRAPWICDHDRTWCLHLANRNTKMAFSDDIHITLPPGNISDVRRGTWLMTERVNYGVKISVYCSAAKCVVWSYWTDKIKGPHAWLFAADNIIVAGIGQIIQTSPDEPVAYMFINMTDNTEYVLC